MSTAAIRQALQEPIAGAGVEGMQLRFMDYGRTDGSVNFMIVKDMGRGALVGRLFAHAGEEQLSAEVAAEWARRAAANIRRYERGAGT